MGAQTSFSSDQRMGSYDPLFKQHAYFPVFEMNLQISRTVRTPLIRI